MAANALANPGTLTSKATYSIKVAGNALPSSVNVLSVAVKSEVNRLAGAQILIADGNAAQQTFPVSSENYFVPGTEVEIAVGYGGQDNTIFKGMVVKQSLKIRENGSPSLLVDCKHAALKLTLAPKSRYFLELSDDEAIAELLDGLSIENEVQSTGFTHKELVQYNVTDWDFIQLRAEANGLLTWCDQGKVFVKKPDFEEDTVLDAAFGASILEFDAEMDAQKQWESLETAAWDHSQQEWTTVEATEPNLPDWGNLTAADLSQAISTGKNTLPYAGFLAEPQLQSWADAQLMRSRLDRIKGRAKLKGNASVGPGKFINLSGVGDRFSGKTMVTGVRHELTKGTWFTHIQFGLEATSFVKQFDVQPLPAKGLTPHIKGLHIGLVTDLDDPDGAYRVKVKIPAISQSEEGAWARMATPDAGNERGQFFRPEVGNEVVVGFLEEDPSQAIILGGLFSAGNPSPIDQNNDNHQKGFVTRSSMKFLFDDEKKSATLETPAGKSIVLDEDAGTIEIKDENGNKIVMDSNGITIESASDLKIKAANGIKLEAVNFEAKGSASAKLNGSGSAEVSSSGSTTIRGSIVQIN